MPEAFSGETVAGRLTRLTRAGSAELVWTNPLAGRTYRFVENGREQYVKVSSAQAPASRDLIDEADRLRWAGRYVLVPEVVGTGRDADGTWLRTWALPGDPASDARWLADPVRVARSLGLAARFFHDQLAGVVDSCPWGWRIADRLRSASGSGGAQPMVADAPPETDLVVAHGDLCAPNVLLTADGEVSGFVDLGRLGVADRAADLGTLVWSLRHNGLGDVVEELFEAYGRPVERDAAEWYCRFYAIG